jgi:3-hydroxybutyryl-CoA dehydrogenase
MVNKSEIDTIEVGVVGLGLMGTSIVVALLVAGHRVKGVAPLPEDMDRALQRIMSHLRHCEETGLLSNATEDYLNKLTLSEDYNILKNCKLVQECVVEIKEVKAAVYNKILDGAQPEVVIASNTSAIPISDLQELLPCPDRFLGIHWAEPAYMTRFLEITKGKKTSDEWAQWVFDLSHLWNKEPTFLQKDIRGFVTNRLMYAVYREIFYLVENGETSLEDVDKAFRYDVGSWITFMGVFRRMDYLGLEDYPTIFRNIFPQLHNGNNVPLLMQKKVDQKARGIINGHGLFSYTKEEARQWEESFARFNKDIYRLAEIYSSYLSEK